MDVKRTLRSGAHDRLNHALVPLARERDFSVIRDVILHRGWVGHVVVGPPGVYALEPRRWRGSVQLRKGRITRTGMGTESAIKDALESATRIRRRLASGGLVITVGAVIALTDAKLPAGPIDLHELAVVGADMLPTWFKGRRRRLDVMEVDAAVEMLTPHEEGPVLRPKHP